MCKSTAPNKYVREVLDALRSKGWIVRDSGKHYVAKHPDINGIVTVASTPRSPSYLSTYVRQKVARRAKENGLQPQLYWP